MTSIQYATTSTSTIEATNPKLITNDSTTLASKIITSTIKIIRNISVPLVAGIVSSIGLILLGITITVTFIAMLRKVKRGVENTSSEGT